ncbi:MAG: type 1 glutamine amidotransferase [Spirochaetes bacterium]|nr:type 1 glutamine amidotransferase [Spirochaetota bacterium]
MKLKNKRILCLVHEAFEDLEFWYPYYRLQEEGAILTVAGEKGGEVYHGKYGVPVTSEIAYGEADPNQFDALLVPGGWAPDKIRRFAEVRELVRTMNQRGAVLGQICHAGWVFISAGILRGRKVTSTPAIRDDMTNAGAIWVDEPVVIDGNLVSSRRPSDLPLYARALIDLLL